MEDIKICAVKVSAKIPNTDLLELENFCNKNKIRCRRFNRQHLVVYDEYTYTFFKKSQNSYADQHVNISKLKAINDIPDCIHHLAWLIDTEPKFIFHQIDNITSVTNLRRKIDLEQFIDENDDLIGLINYNAEIFPGLFVRGPKGKAILFRSGKIVFVGCKNREQVDNLNTFIRERCVNM